MKLEESINNLKKLIELRKNKSSVKYDTCICGTKDLETVLRELEKLRKDSIPKKKIEDRIKELRLSGGSNGKDEVGNTIRCILIEQLQELLEGN